MKNTLKSLGIAIVTGTCAIFGTLVGTMLFKPECVTFKITDDKSKDEAE